MIKLARDLAAASFYLAGCVLWLGPVLTFCVVRDYFRDPGFRDMIDRLAEEEQRK